MKQRRKHEAQLERWARLALRGSLLAGAIAVMLAASGGPQKVAAADATEPVDDAVIANMHRQLEAKAAATCPMCGKPKGDCCCGGTDKCTCGK